MATMSETAHEDRWISPEMRQFLAGTSDARRRHRRRFGYYHRDNERFFAKLVPPETRVAVIGADVLDIASALGSKDVLALDLAGDASATTARASVRRVRSLDDLFAGGAVDYVLLPYTLQLLDDMQSFLEALHERLDPRTRVVLLQYNFLWSPLYRAAQWMGFKTAYPDTNWLNVSDVCNLAALAGYEEITSGGRCLVPMRVPLLSDAVNRYTSPVPFLAALSQKSYFIMRKRPEAGRLEALRTSVIVPARNEQGNIGPLIERLPALGPDTEVIFVEGHSKDDTWGEIQRQIAAHAPHGKFRFQAHQQKGKGKADAVRLGFQNASADILMILDADLSVRPEDLVHFREVFVRQRAEFVNGSRLVYNMEKQAMQLLNLFFNKVFGILLSWVIGQPVKDTLCGTKVLLRSDYERIRRYYYEEAGKLDPFGDFELLFGASRLNLKILDVPVRYKERVYGSTNIQRFRHGWQLLKMMMVGWGRLK